MESTNGFKLVLCILLLTMSELMITDFVGRIHREDNGRIIIEIPEIDQERLLVELEVVPIRITVEKLETNSWMSA